MEATALFWLMVAPALTGCVLALMADAFGSRESHASSAIAAALLGAAGLAGVVGGATTAPTPVYETFSVGGAQSTVSGLILALTGAAVASLLGSKVAWRGRVTVLAALAATAGVLAASSTDLVLTFLALETVSVCAYALVGASRSRASSESALKYFVQGAVATAVLVMGIGVLSAVTRGDAAYSSLSKTVLIAGVTIPIVAGFALVFVGLAFKVGLAPFHTWAPDAYQCAPAPAAGVLAGPAKLAAGSALAIFFFSAVPASEAVFESGSAMGDLLPILGVIAALSMVWGSLGALGQGSYTRMLGYAAIAQAGYALVAVVSLNPGAAIMQLSLYALGSVAAFVGAFAVTSVRPEWDGSIAGLKGVARAHPLLGASIALAMVSLVGIPPLAGFWGKFQVFGAAVSASSALGARGLDVASWCYAGLVVVGIASSVVSVAYYGAVVRALYSGEGESSDAADSGGLTVPIVVTCVLAGALLVIGWVPFLLGLEAPLRLFAL
ncbi:MAG: proton-conducting transporter membrane subunit [Coriobacteriia bacterium]|nr:proton-conducting transporter membrane subunit [Coriobacteriia bacterium]